MNEDVTLMKNFRMTESKSLQLRLEMYSATNSPQWGTPNTSFGGNTFGQITSAGGAPDGAGGGEVLLLRTAESEVIGPRSRHAAAPIFLREHG